MEPEYEPNAKRADEGEATPALFTVSDVANYLQVSNSTVYRLIRDGSLSGIKVGQSLRFTRKNIEDMLTSSTQYHGV